MSLAGSGKKRDENLLNLMDLLVAGSGDSESIYRELYPGKDYSEKQIRNLRSELFLRLLDFLVVEEFLQSGDRALYLARMLNRMQASRFFPGLMDRYVEDISREPLGLEQADLYNRLRMEYLVHQAGVEGRKGREMEHLRSRTETAWVARMLYLEIAAIESQIRYPGKDAPNRVVLWPEILKALKDGAWGDSLLVQIYYALYLLVVFPENPDNWVRTRKLLTAQGAEMPHSEAEQMYTIALNHCIRRRNLGDESQLPEIFHLYQEMLDRQVLNMRSQIGVWHFKSVVTCATRLGHFEWTAGFIDRYQSDLPQNFQENLVNFCRGILDFSQGNFQAAETRMNVVLDQYVDPFFGLDARSYLLRIYYELGNVTGMDALINSFRLFLRRHKHLSGDRLSNYKEFIRFFRRFVTLPPGKTARSQKLLKEIRESPHQAGKDWFIKKLESRK